MNRTTIIDCHAVGHYLKHSMHGLQSSGSDTGIIYGFLNQLKTYAETMNPDQYVFAWDSSKSHRRRLFPEYKRKRGKKVKEMTPEEKVDELALMEQLTILRDEIIPNVGFSNSFISAGYEGDDIIASCVLSLPGKKYIVSRDGDLFQLLSRDTSMWDFQKKQFFTADDFINKWGIKPHEWKMVKAIGGCTTDEVPGVPGVGEGYAVKYIKGELPSHYKVYQKIKESGCIIERNKALVILPFKNTPKYNVKKDRVKIEPFWAMCEQYEFNSIIARFDDWVEAFNME